MSAVPVHSQSTDSHNLPAGQQHGVPLLLQRAPAAFDHTRRQSPQKSLVSCPSKFGVSRRSESMRRSAESGHRTAPVSLRPADHGPSLGGLCRHCRSVFFPPNAYSPKLTFVFVSTEISSVSRSSPYFVRAALTLSKIALVSLVFLNGLPL